MSYKMIRIFKLTFVKPNLNTFKLNAFSIFFRISYNLFK